MAPIQGVCRLHSVSVQDILGKACRVYDFQPEDGSRRLRLAAEQLRLHGLRHLMTSRQLRELLDHPSTVAAPSSDPRARRRHWLSSLRSGRVGSRWAILAQMRVARGLEDRKEERELQQRIELGTRREIEHVLLLSPRQAEELLSRTLDQMTAPPAVGAGFTSELLASGR